MDIKMSNGITICFGEKTIRDLVDERKNNSKDHLSEKEILDSVRNMNKEVVIHSLISSLFKKDELDVLYNKFMEELDAYERNIEGNF